LIAWTSITNYFKKVLNLSEQSTYLSRLVDNLESLNANGTNLPFIITDLKEKGFGVRVCDLYGYISFNHMPWDYSNHDAWRTVFPHIIGKIFFSKLHKLTRDPLNIILNGDIPQFKIPELIEDKCYQGIIINKVNYGIFVDIGYAFNWNCGSIVGLLHRSNFNTDEQLAIHMPGEIIDVLFWGYNEHKKLIFGKNTETKEWITGEILKLVGSVVPVHVIRKDDDTTFLVKNKFKGTMPTSKEIYPRKRREIRKAVRMFQHGDIVFCEILHANESQRILKLKLIPAEISKITSSNLTPKKGTKNTIENLMANEISEKLYMIGEIVRVKVNRKADYRGIQKVTYIVEDKYQGDLDISNENYKISDKEKRQIVQNLQDGEVLDCRVLSFDKNQITVKWQVPDDELHRFLNQDKNVPLNNYH